MESLHPNQQSVQESDRLGVNTALCVDLWAYGGATGKLREVIWRSEGALANLFGKTVAENEGKFIEANQNKLLLFFENPLGALSAAKSLQLNLLTFDQGPFAGQIVPKMLQSYLNGIYKSFVCTPSMIRDLLHGDDTNQGSWED